LPRVGGFYFENLYLDFFWHEIEEGSASAYASAVDKPSTGKLPLMTFGMRIRTKPMRTPPQNMVIRNTQ
jgi:hypothetical protein